MAKVNLVKFFDDVEKKIATSRKSGVAGHTGHFGIVEYHSEKSMRKGSKKDRNPFLGRVTQKLRITIRSENYKQEPGTDPDRSAAIADNIERLNLFCIRYRSTGTICFQIKPESITERTLFVDDREATKDEEKEILAWVTPSKDKPKLLSLKLAGIRRIAMEGETFENVE